MTGAAPPLSVYMHFPWCVRKCPYCDFNSHKAGPAEQRDGYLQALAVDVGHESRRFGERPVVSVFLGGGTPSLFSPAQIAAALRTLDECFRLADNVEITMEANPGTLERGRMADYRAAGVNRLSLGAQSFNDESLNRLGRIHDVDSIVDSVREAREAGFDNINLDLMFALPGQDRAAAIADLEAALALEPEHLSYYQLTLEPNTVFFSRPPVDLPDMDTAADMHDAGIETLSAAGFHRYEVSAFARRGRECLHNLNYWRFGDYAGIGAGAHGKHTEPSGRVTRTRKVANPAQYEREWLDAAGSDNVEALSPDDLDFEFMLNVLRLTEGFTPELFQTSTGRPFAAIRHRLVDLAEQGLMQCDHDSAGGEIWRANAHGFRFLNELQAAFLPAETAPRTGFGAVGTPIGGETAS